MAVNSPSSNHSLLHSSLYVDMKCLTTSPGSFIFISFSIAKILLFLPLCVLVLYLGVQRWRQQQRSMTSHSDVFTYHMVAAEMIDIFGCILSCCGIFIDHINLLSVGYMLSSFTWYDVMLFHTLTCVERYLAVVHPVTYLSLRGERGVRIRNVTVWFVWPFSIVAITLETFNNFSAVNVFLLVFSLVVMAFCSLSVLRVLIRPGPGEQGGDREGGDQSKRRAFYTITAILGALMLKCSVNLIWVVLHVFEHSTECVAMAAEYWASPASSLVLPLLFLQRAGALACCKNNT